MWNSFKYSLIFFINSKNDAVNFYYVSNHIILSLVLPVVRHHFWAFYEATDVAVDAIVLAKHLKKKNKCFNNVLWNKSYELNTWLKWTTQILKQVYLVCRQCQKKDQHNQRFALHLDENLPRFNVDEIYFEFKLMIWMIFYAHSFLLHIRGIS